MKMPTVYLIASTALLMLSYNRARCQDCKFIL